MNFSLFRGGFDSYMKEAKKNVFFRPVGWGIHNDFLNASAISCLSRLPVFTIEGLSLVVVLISQIEPP